MGKASPTQKSFVYQYQC